MVSVKSALPKGPSAHPPAEGPGLALAGWAPPTWIPAAPPHQLHFSSFSLPRASTGSFRERKGRPESLPFCVPDSVLREEEAGGGHRCSVPSPSTRVPSLSSFPLSPAGTPMQSPGTTRAQLASSHARPTPLVQAPHLAQGVRGLMVPYTDWSFWRPPLHLLDVRLDLQAPL